MPTKALKANYAAPGADRTICAYNQQGLQLKESWLRDSKAVLRAVGKALELQGWKPALLTSNRGGIAVSGESYGYFMKPGFHTLFVEFTTGLLRGGGMSERASDGALIMVQYRQESSAHRIVGNNIYLPVMDSNKLMAELIRLERKS